MFNRLLGKKREIVPERMKRLRKAETRLSCECVCCEVKYGVIKKRPALQTPDHVHALI